MSRLQESTQTAKKVLGGFKVPMGREEKGSQANRVRSLPNSCTLSDTDSKWYRRGSSHGAGISGKASWRRKIMNGSFKNQYRFH